MGQCKPDRMISRPQGALVPANPRLLICHLNGGKVGPEKTFQVMSFKEK